MTFVTADRRPLLGRVVEDKVELSPAGEIVARCWAELPQQFEGLTIDAFQIMPDHVHGIIFIVGVIKDGKIVRSGVSLPSVMQKLKGRSSIEINRLIGSTGNAVWQKSYDERIIRDDRELEKFRNYILTNPLREFLDRTGPGG